MVFFDHHGVVREMPDEHWLQKRGLIPFSEHIEHQQRSKEPFLQEFVSWENTWKNSPSCTFTKSVNLTSARAAGDILSL
jgi:hypothetical protein